MGLVLIKVGVAHKNFTRDLIIEPPLYEILYPPLYMIMIYPGTSRYDPDPFSSCFFHRRIWLAKFIVLCRDTGRGFEEV